MLKIISKKILTILHSNIMFTNLDYVHMSFSYFQKGTMSDIFDAEEDSENEGRSRNLRPINRKNWKSRSI